MIPIVFPDVSRARFAMCAIALTLAMCAMTGCATSDRWSWRSLGVYKIDINQGNYLSQDMVDKLKVGMTQTQVKQILGTPLVASPFRPDRWDYVYEYTRQGQVIEHRNFIVWFADAKVARWEGDAMPESVLELNRSASAKALPSSPPAEKGAWDRFLDVFSK
jgi:outer membrane protein assembly factor BamE (lipoprotein component of BamABCDE complex)